MNWSLLLESNVHLSFSVTVYPPSISGRDITLSFSCLSSVLMSHHLCRKIVTKNSVWFITFKLLTFCLRDHLKFCEVQVDPAKSVTHNYYRYFALNSVTEVVRFFLTKTTNLLARISMPWQSIMLFGDH